VPVHNKLVRDKILDIINSTGKQFTSKTLDEKEYAIELKKKLNEEISEYFSAKDDTQSIEELADIMEVIYCLTKIHKSSPEHLEEVRLEKNKKRGSFEDKLFLIEVKDE
jgi:predicted house-cleaning noncanonical NTP pyrophosphatase (MazG superfamily)